MTFEEKEQARGRAIRRREIEESVKWEKANRPQVGVSRRYVGDAEWLLAEIDRLQGGLTRSKAGREEGEG
jgi:hypothetical protein